MASTPSANVTIDAEAGALAGGTGYCVVIAAVSRSADAVPRVFASAKSLLAQHGYAPGVDYAAIHLEATRKPVIFVGLPIVTAGAVASPVSTGVIGTSVITVTAGTDGILEETLSTIKVTKGGTIATTGIEFDYSLDGQKTWKSVRLGTASSYTVPYVGLVFNFAAGTLIAGDIFTFKSSAPLWDNAGMTSARTALATQKKPARSWLVIGDVVSSTVAGYVTAAVNAYETSNRRFTYARINARDRAATGETMAAFVAAMDTAFASVDGQKRIDIGLGRLRKLSPITGWMFRRPVAWAASVREYQHDVHTTTWNKEDGPLDGWVIDDGGGNVVEYDQDTDGGALEARFTCARTWGNGPNGAFIAQSVTRATAGSVLGFTHNMAVANVACSIVQASTENIVGKTLVLKPDGTATAAALQVIEEAINTDLKQALEREFVPGEGQRASFATWRASTTDNLGGSDATLTGVLTLKLRGTIVHVDTLVKVS